MDFSLTTLLEAARFTMQNPRSGAQMVMRLDLPIGARWAALALMAVLSTLLTLASLAMSPLASDPAVVLIIQKPIALAIFEFGVMALTALLIHRVGRAAGGQGQFTDGLILLVWLQIILMLLQMVQLAAQLIFPGLADIIGLIGMVLFMWLLTNFVAELHGFRRLWPVFGGILGTGFAVSMTLAILMLVVVGG